MRENKDRLKVKTNRSKKRKEKIKKERMKSYNSKREGKEMTDRKMGIRSL